MDVGTKDARQTSGLPDAKIDFALVARECLVVYGWVVTLFESLSAATLVAGDVEIDLLGEAVRVSRPDVSAHFRTAPSGSHDHGFFVLLDRSQFPSGVQQLRLVVRTRAGASGESVWPVAREDDLAAATLREHERAMRLLIPRLAPRQVRLLTGCFTPPLILRSSDLDEAVATQAPATPIDIRLCGWLEEGILVLGMVLPQPLRRFQALKAVWGTHAYDLLRAPTRAVEFEVSPVPVDDAPGRPDQPSGVMFALPVPENALSTDAELRLQFATRETTGAARHAVTAVPRQARERMLAYFTALHPDVRIDVCESIRGLTTGGAAQSSLADVLDGQILQSAQALPASVDYRGRRTPLQLHVDTAVRCRDRGFLIAGWFDVDDPARFRVECHTPAGTFDVSGHWARRPRPDVRTFLAEIGRPSVAEAGFCCYVPLDAGAGPCYLSATVDGGRTRRARVPLSDAPEPDRVALQRLLSLVDPNGAGLRGLMDRHIGPAVASLWATRTIRRENPFVAHYGPPVAEPSVSIVVPLYGRHDFADYQLALFADDPDFRQADLIYVMDDPSLVEDFRRLCPDLHAMHGVPFTLAYPGANLGFAGATNHGAALARAPYVLMLNSDVMPMRAGWLSELLRIYRSRPDTGVLGVKLLYEDGTVQHAGMEYAPYAPWQNLTINRHPHKGLSPVGLAGVVDVPAVTAACALLETALYRSLGGLSEDFVIGDFEDSDLCLRAQAAGRVNRVALDVGLYHLERQSQDLAGDQAFRTAVTLYNCWLHDRRWGSPAREPA